MAVGNEAAWWQEMIEQIRRNTATLRAVASMLGMILAGWLGVLLLDAAMHRTRHAGLTSS